MLYLEARTTLCPFNTTNQNFDAIIQSSSLAVIQPTNIALPTLNKPTCILLIALSNDSKQVPFQIFSLFNDKSPDSSESESNTEPNSISDNKPLLSIKETRDSLLTQKDNHVYSLN